MKMDFVAKGKGHKFVKRRQTNERCGRSQWDPCNYLQII